MSIREEIINNLFNDPMAAERALCFNANVMAWKHVRVGHKGKDMERNVPVLVVGKSELPGEHLLVVEPHEGATVRSLTPGLFESTSRRRKKKAH